MTLQHPHAELSAYIDGELDPAAQAAVDGHLDTCAVCRAHVAQLRGTVALMRALPDPIPSRRLTPRVSVPVWLAPLRTLMTMASGAAVFLFIASALVSNITFLAGGSATSASAPEAVRDAAVKGQVPPAPQSTAGPSIASPNVAFALSPAASPSSQPSRAVQGPGSSEAAARGDQASATPSSGPDVALSPQDTGRLASSEPRPSPLVNPLLWLTVAILCGAIAIALHRRLRATA